MDATPSNGADSARTSESQANVLGTQIGHYRLDALLGRGGMGEVFRGHDTRLNRPVAIKVLSPAFAHHEHSVERFLREARAASALNHPNIVTIYEADVTPAGGHYIAQELIEGQTLRALLQPPGLTLESQLDIAQQIARGLATAHAAGIVHRDIKPENVMVRADGYVKVLDFGLAHLPDPEPGDQTKTDQITATGLVLGTAAYMSPEQAQGQPVDTRSDIFSFGVLLYEMATGRRPFTEASIAAVLTAIVSQHPVPAARVNPAVPAGLEGLVQQMLAKDRALRPTASEVEATLGRLGRPRGDAGAAIGLARRTTVGREAERAELRAALARASAGESAFLTITGEPGIGKTVLVEDFLAELEVHPLRPVVARGRCSERLAGSEAYLPVLEALDDLLRQKSGESFGEVMKSAAPTWYVHVATLTPGGSSAEQLRANVRSVSQERMKRELTALLQQISQIRPIVLFFDDLHWADASTIDLLNYVAIHFDNLRVLVLGAYRPSEMAVAQHPYLEVRADLQTRGVLREMMLGFLDRADIEHYLTLEFPEHEFPPALRDLVYARTEGNALFMADLLRYLKDRHVITRDGGRWKLAGMAADVARDLPDSVRSMIARKIDRLEDADRQVLVTASVQGHAFDSTVVSDALEMPPEEVEERLERLSRVHVLVKPAGEQEFADRVLTLRYRFVHILYQNTLYASLQPTRRASLSGRVAAAIVRHECDQSPEGAARLAVLFEAARDFRTASAQYLTAAKHAVTLLAFREAEGLARRGLNALQALPEGSAHVQLELELQVNLGLSLRSLQGWAAPEVERVYTRARQLCQQLGDTPELFPVLWALTLYHTIRGDLRVYQPLAEQLLVEANATGQPLHLVAAHQMVGTANEYLGNTVVASHHYEQAIASYRPKQHLDFMAHFGMDPGMSALSLSVRPLWFLGFPDRALARIQEAVALARALKDPLSIVFAVCLAEQIHLLRGEAAESVALGDEMIAICRAYGLVQELEWGRSIQGLALVDLGRAEEGVEQLKDGLNMLERIGTGVFMPVLLAFLGEALLETKQFEQGLRSIDAGFEAAEHGLERFFLAELHRLRGELLQRTGDAAGAERSFRQAIDFARTQGARSLELRAATGLARLLEGTDRAGEARQQLSALYDTFTEGHATRDLRSAAALVAARSENG